MTEKKERERTQLVIDTSVVWNAIAGLLLSGGVAGHFFTIQFGVTPARAGGGESVVVLQRLESLRRDVDGMRLIYGQLQDDHFAADQEGSQARRQDRRHESAQDEKIEVLDEKVGTLSKEL